MASASHVDPIHMGCTSHAPGIRQVDDSQHAGPSAAVLPPGPQPSHWANARECSLLSDLGEPKDSEAGRKQFALLMEKRRAEESSADYEQVRRDWVLGSEAFR